MRLFVTGGCGFVGSNFIRYVLQHYGPEMVSNVDNLTTGRLANVEGLAETYGERYEFLHADVAESGKVEALLNTHQFYAVVHFAAEAAGLAGTKALLDQAREHGVRRFLVVSREDAGNSLAPLEAAAIEAHVMYGQEVIITRATDTYGPYQALTSLIPGVITSVLRDEPARMPGDGLQTRDWLHVEDHCAALFAALLDGEPGTVHRLATGHELRDFDLAQRILEKLGKNPDMVQFAPTQTGAGRQNGRSVPVASTLDWKPRQALETGLRETIDWYIRNREWWEKENAR